MNHQQEQLEAILTRLLADVDDDMEFAGTMWKSKDHASQSVKRDLEEAIQAITALIQEAREKDSNIIHSEFAKLKKKYQWNHGERVAMEMLMQNSQDRIKQLNSGGSNND